MIAVIAILNYYASTKEFACGASGLSTASLGPIREIGRLPNRAGCRRLRLRRFRRSRKTSSWGDRLEPLRKHQLFDALCDHFIEPLPQVKLAFQVRDGCCF